MIWIAVGVTGFAAFVWTVCAIARQADERHPKPWDEEIWWL